MPSNSLFNVTAMFRIMVKTVNCTKIYNPDKTKNKPNMIKLPLFL